VLRWPYLPGVLLIAAAASPALPAAPRLTAEVVDELKRVHARFHGTPGTVARWGDQLTATPEFFAPLREPHRNVDEPTAALLRGLQGRLARGCWDWQAEDDAPGLGPGQRTSWALQKGPSGRRRIDEWLAAQQPEVVVILWGTNDLGAVDPAAYHQQLTEIVRTAKNHGSIPLVTTVPPRVGKEREAYQFALAARQVAAAERVPLIDLHREVLRRAPGGKWAGTLIDADGASLTAPKEPGRDFDEAALNRHGQNLRNYLTLHALGEVDAQVLAPFRRTAMHRWAGAGLVGLTVAVGAWTLWDLRRSNRFEGMNPLAQPPRPQASKRARHK